MTRFLLAMIVSLLLMPWLVPKAFAACSSPTGSAGNMMYNSDQSVMQYCDGTYWRAMGPLPTSAAPLISNGANAIDELGQYASTSADTTLVYTTGGKNNNNGTTISALGLDYPESAVVDTKNHRLFVADPNNNRTLVYLLNSDDTLPTASGGHTASYVLGQTGFTTNTSAASQTGESIPTGLAYDTVNDRLFVVESGNSRVMIYNVAPGTIANGEAASNVLGQANWTSSSQALTQTGMYNPFNVAYDSANSRLFVSDFHNNRVVIYDVLPADLTTYHTTLATYVIGQADFTHNTSSLTQAGLTYASGVAYDATDNLLFVSDTNSPRVTVYNVAPSYLSGGTGGACNSGTYGNGEKACYVLGQANFTSAAFACTQAGLSSPVALAYDDSDSLLFSFDTSCNRATAFNVAPANIANGENASYVLGQSTWTGSSGATTQTGMSYPYGGAFDSTNGRLYVDDRNNDRVMVYDVSGSDTGSGLLAWWKLDDGSGSSAVDSSGNSKTATLSGSPTWTTGKIGGALTLASSGQYGDTSNFADNLSNFTVSGWFKYTSTPTNRAGAIVSKIGSNGVQTGTGWFLGINNSMNSINANSVVAMVQMDGSDYLIKYTNAAYNDGNWHHAAMVVTGGTTVTLYVDGSTSGISSQNGGTVTTYSTTSNVRIGTDYNTEYLKGTLDDLRVYNRALSASEVAALYTAGAGSGGSGGSSCSSAGNMMYNNDYHVPQYCNGTSWIAMGPVPGTGGSGCGSGTTSGLVGWWKMDEGSGTTTADSSGSGNTGSLINNPPWVANGRVNGAITCNSAASRDIVVNDSASLKLSGSWTESGWVNLASFPSSGLFVFMLSRNNGDSGDNYNLMVDNGYLSAGLGWAVDFNTHASPGTDHYAKYTTSISTGVWYHVAGVYDSTAQTLTLYLNGVAVASQSVSGFSPDTFSLNNVGLCNNSGGFILNGTIDDIRVYNRALSAGEIYSLYNIGAEGDLLYNADNHVMQYCDGTNWEAMRH